MERTSSPAVDRARTADSRPAPGPLTATSTVRSPDSFALFAAVKDACCAAKGVPFRDPRKPSEPELGHEITLPMGSVMVTIVLLNDACTWTRPIGTERFSFFLNAFFLPVFAGAFAIFYPLRFRRRLLLVGNRAAPRTLPATRFVVRPRAAHRQAPAVTQAAIGAHFDETLDVHRGLFPQVAFNRAFRLDNSTNLVDLFLGQIGDLGVRVDARAVAERVRPGPSDSVNISETDLGPFFRR